MLFRSETVAYFVEQYGSLPNSFLLILSPDIAQFTATLAQSTLTQSQYRVINVPTQELISYLAAADVGFLFRHPDIINWVSRPTKVLEYSAAGLRIVHNGTVGYCVGMK